MPSRPSVALLVVTTTLACASRREPHPALSTAADPVRCAAFADSVHASAQARALPLVTPIGRPQLPTPPRGHRPQDAIRTSFVVRPDGTVDSASVTVTGVSSGAYRGDMQRVLARTRFRPAMVEGCPSWGRGEFIMVGYSGVELRRQ